MRYLDAKAVAALGPAAAVRAIVDALRGGLDPSADPPRVPIGLSHGQFLLMPAQTPSAVGVKVVTVAPGNPARGLPRIQAAYLLFDPATLTLQAILDGTALTALRTAAVSVAAVLAHLPDRAVRTVIIGAGPQAVAHAATLAAVHPVADTTYLVREPARTQLDALLLGSQAADEALRSADIVICATSARTPLFDSTLLREAAVVVAVGSHEPDARELDAALLGRAKVIVEDVATALREAGDVVLAIDEGRLRPDELVTMRDALNGPVNRSGGRPVVFKSVGMSWEDLVIASAVLAAVPRSAV